MSGFALVWLAVFAVTLVAVIAVRSIAARVLRTANEPRADLPPGEAFAHDALESRGLGAVSVVSADVDAYRGISREIQLAGGRFEHGSAASCAVAALEVAHAMQHESGFVPWRRWWVISGHTMWAGPLLLVVLLLTLVVGSPLLVLLTFACIAVLAISGTLSLVVEHTAVATARELLAESSLSGQVGDPDIDRTLRWASRAYIAESVFDLGFLDRAIEPYRGPQ